MNYYKGDTLDFNYYLEINKEKVKLGGSKIVALIYERFNGELYKMKEFNTEKEQTDVYIIFTSDEMKDIKCKDYIIEIKVVNEKIKTTYQDCLHVIEGWCL